MKRYILIALFGLSSGVMAGIWTQDTRCLRLAGIAEGTAKQLAQGRSVEELNRETPEDEFVHRVVRDITGFVAVMGLGPVDARKLVYLKCKGGTYDPNAKELREMRRK